MKRGKMVGKRITSVIDSLPDRFTLNDVYKRYDGIITSVSPIITSLIYNNKIRRIKYGTYEKVRQMTTNERIVPKNTQNGWASDLIDSAINNLPQQFSRLQIVKNCKNVSEKTIYKRLKRLKDSGKIIKIGAGMYKKADPTESTLFSNTKPDTSVSIKAETKPEITPLPISKVADSLIQFASKDAIINELNKRIV